MDKEGLIEQLERVVADGYRHENYGRTVEVADFAYKVMTGKCQDELIIQYKLKESKELKKQRIRLTNPITPIVGNQISSVYKRLPRVDGIKSELVLKDKLKEEIEKVLLTYQGETSFEKYIDTRQPHFEFHDPNAWLVYESKEVRNSEGDLIGHRFYPLEVSAEQAVDFGFDCGDLDYLIVNHTKIEEKKEVDESKYIAPPLDATALPTNKENLDIFYAYTAGLTIVWKEYRDDVPEIEDDTKQSKIEVNGKTFLQEIHINKTVETPAKRWGSILDPCTNGATFVTPLEPAEGLLRDIIRDKSYLDLTKTEHTFLQKYVYAEVCDYEDEKSGQCCERGCLGGFEEAICPGCDGSGLLWHTSEQEVIAISMPDGSTPDAPKLSEMAHYVNLPHETPKFQTEELDKELKRVFAAVFNLDIFDTPKFSETATASIIEGEKINDVLSPFSDKNCELTAKGFRVACQHYQVPEGYGYKVIPKDLKLKSTGTLITEYKNAQSAGLSSSVLDGIEMDLITKQYQNDPLKVLKYQVQKKHIPWRNKTAEERRQIIADRSFDDRDRFFYENDTRIFCEIEEEDEKFYQKNFKDQVKVIDAKIDELLSDVSSEKVTTVNRLNIGEEEE